MRRIALFVLPLITLFPLSANALTVRDVIELTRAGLGEEIILALIEVDPSVFPIDTETLKTLKDAGVSPRVIVAMVRSGRTQPPPAADQPPPIIEDARAPEPQVIVIDHHDPQIQQVPIAVPVYVPFPVTTHRTHVDDRIRNAPDPFDAARRLDVRAADDARRDVERARQPAPVYWGFGGQLRPDAWQPTPVKKDKDR
jgi:hypothetical protein